MSSASAHSLIFTLDERVIVLYVRVVLHVQTASGPGLRPVRRPVILWSSIPTVLDRSDFDHGLSFFILSLLLRLPFANTLSRSTWAGCGGQKTANVEKLSGTGS